MSAPRDPGAPLGVFDSGLGGLTVVRAILERCPSEDIVYLGDTARVPYGTRSPETVKVASTSRPSRRPTMQSSATCTTGAPPPSP